MPGPDALTEILNWIDEPAAQARAVEREAAVAAFNVIPVEPEPRRKGLDDLINRFPWTPSAWEALDELAKGH